MTKGFRQIILASGIGLALAAASALAAPSAPGFSASDLQAINARMAKATRIANQIRQVEPMDDSNFVSLSQALLGASPAGLEAAASAKSYKGAMDAIRSAKGTDSASGREKVLGSSTSDFVFKPITPCRLLDTRAGGGPVVANTPYGVDFDGGNAGNAAGCTFIGVFGMSPWSNAALAFNLTVVSPSGNGYIVARPVGSTQVAATQNFTTGQNVASLAIVQDAGTSNEFELLSSTTTHAVVDMVGVFTQVPATALDCLVVTTSQAVAAGAAFSFNSAACPAGYTYTGSGMNQTGVSTGEEWWQVSPNATSGAPTASTCRGYNTSGSSSTTTCYATCCRVPGGP